MLVETLYFQGEYFATSLKKVENIYTLRFGSSWYFRRASYTNPDSRCFDANGTFWTGDDRCIDAGPCISADRYIGTGPCIGADCGIGAGCWIGAGPHISDGRCIGAGPCIRADRLIGNDCDIGAGSCIGADPCMIDAAGRVTDEHFSSGCDTSHRWCVLARWVWLRTCRENNV